MARAEDIELIPHEHLVIAVEAAKEIDADGEEFVHEYVDCVLPDRTLFSLPCFTEETNRQLIEAVRRHKATHPEDETLSVAKVFQGAQPARSPALTADTTPAQAAGARGASGNTGGDSNESPAASTAADVKATTGVEEQLTQFANAYVLPLARALYPESAHPQADDDVHDDVHDDGSSPCYSSVYGFFVWHEEGGDDDFASWRYPVVLSDGREVLTSRHVDDSDYTFNVCLGTQFTGSQLGFAGTTDSGALPESSPFVYTQVPGIGVLHEGRNWHDVAAIESGTRCNLILWCRVC